MEDVDPDDSFSSVPYEKGFAFLCYLESLVGRHVRPSSSKPTLSVISTALSALMSGRHFSRILLRTVLRRCAARLLLTTGIRGFWCYLPPVKPLWIRRSWQRQHPKQTCGLYLGRTCPLCCAHCPRDYVLFRRARRLP